MDILYVCLYQKRLKEIVSACQPWHWKIFWRGKWAIRRSCVYFSSTVLLIITLQWKSLILIFTGNNAREFSHFFGRCTTPTLHLSKIRHPWLRIYVLPSIWSTAPTNILFHARWSDHREIIMHTNSLNLALCRLKFFFSQSKRVQKKKWSKEVKNICQHLKLQSTSYSALVNSLSCICSDTSIV